jgi:hypothetical protein
MARPIVLTRYNRKAPPSTFTREDATQFLEQQLRNVKSTKGYLAQITQLLDEMLADDQQAQLLLYPSNSYCRKLIDALVKL